MIPNKRQRLINEYVDLFDIFRKNLALLRDVDSVPLEPLLTSAGKQAFWNFLHRQLSDSEGSSEDSSELERNFEELS